MSVRGKLGLNGWRWSAAQGLTRVLSAGLLNAERSEYVVVLQRDASYEVSPATLKLRRRSIA